MSLVPILAAFLLGTIPGALLVARFAGVDLRRAGSGNPGATNAWRLAGRGPGLVALLVDAGKGWVATALLPPLGGSSCEAIAPFCAAAVVLGHVFNPWLAFRGGKGVATAAGAIGGLAPRLLVGPLVFFLIVFAWRRRVSESSLVAAVSLSLVAAIYRLLPPRDWPGADLLLLCGGIALLLLWTHRSNLRRIRAGDEPRLDL